MEDYSPKDENTINHDSSEQFKEVANKIKQVMASNEISADGVNSDIITGEKTTVFEPAIESVERRLGHDEAEAIRNQLVEIDRIDANTVGIIRETGNLPKEIDSKTRSLSLFGVNSDNLTIDEVESVYDYANNASEEIVLKKTERIYDSIITPIETRHLSRRIEDSSLQDREDYSRVFEIQDRFIAWQQGKLDVSKGFDVDAAYEKLLEEGYEPSNSLKAHLEEEDVEDLIEEGLVAEESVFRYGPFTNEDIELAEKALESSWQGVVNWRFNGIPKKTGVRRTETMATIGQRQSRYIERQGANLNNLIKNTVNNSTSNLEQDLVREYVAGEILQSRRLKSREMMIASASLCLDVIDLNKPDKDDSLAKLEYSEARTAASQIAYYSSKILNIDSKEMQKRFGSRRPIKKEFFEEILKAASQMSDDRAEYLDKEFAQIFTKMDEHTHDMVERLTALNSGESPLFSEDLD